MLALLLLEQLFVVVPRLKSVILKIHEFGLYRVEIEVSIPDGIVPIQKNPASILTSGGLFYSVTRRVTEMALPTTLSPDEALFFRICGAYAGSSCDMRTSPFGMC